MQSVALRTPELFSVLLLFFRKRSPLAPILLGSALVFTTFWYSFAKIGAPTPVAPLTRGCTASGLRILLFTVATPGSGASAEVSILLNSVYAHRHGYDFFVERCVPDTTLDFTWGADDHDGGSRINWAKPMWLKKHLPFYDYILFLDADTYVVNATATVEAFIDKHFSDPRVFLVLARDCKNSTYCWHDDAPNCGVLLMRNSVAALDMLDYWLASADGKCNMWKYKHSREQGCLTMLMPEYEGQIKLVHDAQEMNGEDGRWVVHLVGLSEEKRFDILSRELVRVLRHRNLLGGVEARKIAL